MRPVSSRKILILLLIIVALAQWDRISAAALSIYRYFFDAFEPLRNCPAEGRFGVALAILGLLCIVILRLLFDRK